MVFRLRKLAALIQEPNYTAEPRQVLVKRTLTNRWLERCNQLPVVCIRFLSRILAFFASLYFWVVLIKVCFEDSCHLQCRMPLVTVDFSSFLLCLQRCLFGFTLLSYRVSIRDIAWALFPLLLGRSIDICICWFSHGWVDFTKCEWAFILVLNFYISVMILFHY